MDTVHWIKASISGVLAILTALWGWFGWLLIGWVALMGLDWITGTLAARKSGTWSSKMAREGAWHKIGSVMAVMVCGVLDLIIGQVLPNIVGLTMPFAYTVLLCPLVLVWYVLTEAGSIVENAGKLGAPVPTWLKNAIASLHDKVDDAVDAAATNNKKGE